MDVLNRDIGKKPQWGKYIDGCVEWRHHKEPDLLTSWLTLKRLNTITDMRAKKLQKKSTSHLIE